MSRLTFWIVFAFVAVSAAVLARPVGCVAPRGPEASAVAQGPRDALVYDSATSVRFFRRHAVMGGFRYRGVYSRGLAPVLTMPANQRASVLHDLGAEKRVHPENWYAIFAAAKPGDRTTTVKLMPFLKIGKVENGRLMFAPAGEGGIRNEAAEISYEWIKPDVLAGTEALIVSEGGKFSGRTTQIVGSDANAVRVDDPGTLRPGDFILPSPPGYKEFVYIGTFYFDTKEIRNLYDSGVSVKSKMITIPLDGGKHDYTNSHGSMISMSGLISPLATSVVINSSGGLSTSAKGQYVEYYDADGGGHIVETRGFSKQSATTENYTFSNIQVPFMYHQTFFFRSAGPISVSRAQGGLDIVGWLEP